MNSVDWTAALDGVDLASVLLPLLFLTVPGLALSRGLRRFREAAPTRRKAAPAARRQPAAAAGRSRPRTAARSGRAAGETPGRARQKMSGQVLLARFASVVTMLAMAAAGLGLVPLALVVYKAIAGVHKYAPAVIGVVLLVALLAKGLLMILDLKDGRVDKPALWLAPAPMLAVLILAAPVVWGQITDQAHRTAQMVMDGTKHSAHKNPGKPAHEKTGGKGEPRGKSADE